MITQILSHPNSALLSSGAAVLGACYKQLNSSVGIFGTDTLMAATGAIESSSAGDATYLQADQALRKLDLARDALAGQIKGELEAAAFRNVPLHGAGGQIHGCDALLHRAHDLASSG